MEVVALAPWSALVFVGVGLSSEIVTKCLCYAAFSHVAAS